MKTLIAILVLLAIVTATAAWLYGRFFKRVTIFDFQKGLLYRDGKFEKLIDAGVYTLFKPSVSVEIYDMRGSLITIPGQDVLTKDKINIKLSLTANYSVADPLKAHQGTQYYTSEFYNAAQMCLRDIVGDQTLDEVFENRANTDARLLADMQSKAEALGLSLEALAVRDIVLPANLKRAYAGVLEAQKEAQKQLEKARGEAAVLRSLANSSKMYDNNPSLLQARIVQALAEGNNSIVFNSDDKTIVSSIEKH